MIARLITEKRMMMKGSNDRGRLMDKFLGAVGGVGSVIFVTLIYTIGLSIVIIATIANPQKKSRIIYTQWRADTCI